MYGRSLAGREPQPPSRWAASEEARINPPNYSALARQVLDLDRNSYQILPHLAAFESEAGDSIARDDREIYCFPASSAVEWGVIQSSVETHTERIIRHSEVMALVRAIRSGAAPRIGASVDYFIEVPAALERRALARPQNKAQKPYRFEVEQWHLDAARDVLDSTSGR